MTVNVENSLIKLRPLVFAAVLRLIYEYKREIYIAREKLKNLHKEVSPQFAEQYKIGQQMMEETSNF